MTVLALLLALPAFAAVDGMVVNQTTGKPQAGATVTLYMLGGAGMESVESVKSDAQGRFKMDRTPQGPHLIQTAFDGVTYNHMLPPGTPTTGLQLEVYNASKKPGAAKVAQHMVLLEPAGNALAVSETVIYQNPGKTAFDDPQNGTFHFYLPPEAGGKASVECKAPQGMRIQRKAEPTQQANVYKVDFPIKPGETQFDVGYQMPFQSPGEFAGRILQADGVTRLVVPQGVTVQGAGLEPVGQEPRTQASIFTVKGPDYKVQIAGAGSLRGAAAGGDEDDRPQIQQSLPRLYDRLYVVLGLALAILAAGFYLFYRSDAPAPPAQKGKRRA